MKIAHLQFVIVSLICVVALGACDAPAPVATPTVVPTFTPIAIPIPLATLEPTQIPMVIVTETTSCYVGPNLKFDIVATLEAGMQLRVAGQYSASGYLIVVLDSGSQCWVASEYLNAFTGEAGFLPEFTPPPVPTTGPPIAPTNLVANTQCIAGRHFDPTVGRMQGNTELDFDLSWTDNSNDEDGFVVYKNGDDFFRTDQNVTSFSESDQRTNPFSLTVVYEVAAFNHNGESARLMLLISTHCG